MLLQLIDVVEEKGADDDFETDDEPDVHHCRVVYKDHDIFFAPRLGALHAWPRILSPSLMMCENLCKQSSFVRLLHEAVTKLQDRLEGQKGGSTIPLPRADVAYTLYGLENCPFFARAAAALRAAGVKGVCSWTLTDLGVTRQALWAELDAKRDSRESQHRTFPIVSHGDRFLGGCDALLATLANDNMPRRY